MTAKEAKFQLEFSMMMLSVGRQEEGESAFRKVLDYLNERIEREQHIEELKKFVDEGDDYYA